MIGFLFKAGCTKSSIQSLYIMEIKSSAFQEGGFIPRKYTCGDINISHQEIDLARPKENENTSGFMRIERDWIDKIINLGYIDIFREFNKEPGWYTYWDMVTRARERNVGWRIDYFFVSSEAGNMVVNTKIHMDVMGSDHCPIELDIKA